MIRFCLYAYLSLFPFSSFATPLCVKSLISSSGDLSFHSPRFAKALKKQRDRALVELHERKLNNSTAEWEGTLFEIGEKISYKGQAFKVLGVIGIGSEANVYAVETPEGVQTAKIFRRDRWASIKAEFEGLNIMRSRGVKTIKGVGYDSEKGVLMQEYHEGFTLQEIISEAGDIGFSPEEAARIQFKFLQFKEHELIRENPSVLLNFNSIYDINAEEILLIDRA